MKNKILEQNGKAYIVEKATEDTIEAREYIYNTNTSRYEKVGNTVEIDGDYNIVPLTIVRLKHARAIVGYEELTKDEIMALLDEKGIEYNSRDKKDELLELLKEGE